MIQNMFTIYDSKAEAYLPPFFLPTDGMAQRTFAECINSDDHQFGRHPHDFTLFKLGTFDNDGAVIEYHKQTLGNGVEFLNPEKPDNFTEPEVEGIAGQSLVYEDWN